MFNQMKQVASMQQSGIERVYKRSAIYRIGIAQARRGCAGSQSPDWEPRGRSSGFARLESGAWECI